MQQVMFHLLNKILILILQIFILPLLIIIIINILLHPLLRLKIKILSFLDGLHILSQVLLGLRLQIFQVGINTFF